MTQPRILFSPYKSAISTQGGVLDVLVRVQAPDQSVQTKATVTPKRLALVVDRSGSMNGEPLKEALRCVTHIADCLTPADQLSVVVYDNKVNVLLPLAPMKSPAQVRQLVQNIQWRFNRFVWRLGGRRQTTRRGYCIDHLASHPAFRRSGKSRFMRDA
jgi:Ca-activated chloride channel homolog